MRRALLLAILVPAILAACGDDSESGATTSQTAVRVTVDPDGTGSEPPVTVRARCRADGGGRGCRELRGVPANAFRPTPPDTVCTQIFGGPQTARVTGRVRGKRVDARFARTDGCEVARWQLAAPLLALTGVEPGAGAP